MSKVSEPVLNAILKIGKLDETDQAYIAGYIEAAASAEEAKKKKKGAS